MKIHQKRGRPSGRPDTRTLKRLYKMHSAGKIAEMYGVHIQTVKYWLKQVDLKKSDVKIKK